MSVPVSLTPEPRRCVMCGHQTENEPPVCGPCIAVSSPTPDEQAAEWTAEAVRSLVGQTADLTVRGTHRGRVRVLDATKTTRGVVLTFDTAEDEK